MKALTIKQPWASLIVAGTKPIELRTWTTSYRGRLAIHAGAAWDKRGERWRGEKTFASHVHGAIIGTTELYEVRFATLEMHASTGLTFDQLVALTSACDKAGKRLYAWRLRDPAPCTPVPCKGRLGLWETPAFEACQ